MLEEQKQATIVRQTEETLSYLRELRDVMLKVSLVSAHQPIDQLEIDTILEDPSADKRQMRTKPPRLVAIDGPEIHELIDDIDRYVGVMGVPEGPDDEDVLDGSTEQVFGWTFGHVEIYSSTVPIVRGTLERFRRIPISRPLTERAVAFLLAIPGIAEKLKRETHGHWGWHYHYCRSNNERSDTILSFDTGASDKPRPLFSEGHAETDAHFKARPERWNEEKRRSVYAACEPDLRTWTIDKFKHPSKEAIAVWPREAVLAQPQKNVAPSTKKRRGK